MIYYLIGMLAYYKAKKKPVPAGICLLFFLVITIGPISTLFVFLNKHWVFPVIMFVLGLFCWTFIEYFSIRFWFHKRRSTNLYGGKQELHQKKLRQFLTSPAGRLIVVTFAVAASIISFSAGRHLLLPAGIVAGYAIFNCMQHYSTRLRPARWFKKTNKIKGLYHSIRSEKCYGVMTTWWDRLFNTMPIASKKPVGKVKKIDFGKTRKESIAN